MMPNCQSVGLTTLCVLITIMSGCNGNAPPQAIEPDPGRIVIGNDGPEGDSALRASGIRYPLDAALGDIWGMSNDHFQIDFTLTNGNFSVQTVEVDDQSVSLLVPAEATAVFHASLFSPGARFDYTNYAIVATTGVEDQPSGVAYFNEAFVGLDTDNSGMVEPDEQLDIIDGMIDFARSPPDIALSFLVTLSDGQIVEGHYTGLVDFTLR